MVTHNPTWQDCQQLMMTLLNSEEKRRVNEEARKQVAAQVDGAPQDPAAEVDRRFPLVNPN